MKRNVAILGTLLIAAMILISGSAVATYWVVWIDREYVTAPNNIDGAVDYVYAGLGEHIQPADAELGWIILDLDPYPMPPSQLFTVYASSTELEYYEVYVSTGEFPDSWVPEDGWLGDDIQDNDFETPSDFGKQWRYIKLVGITAASTPYDPHFGPEVDAVGW